MPTRAAIRHSFPLPVHSNDDKLALVFGRSAVGSRSTHLKTRQIIADRYQSIISPNPRSTALEPPPLGGIRNGFRCSTAIDRTPWSPLKFRPLGITDGAQPICRRLRRSSAQALES